MTPVVVDASAGVEIALKTPIGLRLEAKIPASSTIWVPEHYYAEAAAALRRIALNGRFDPARVQVALGRLLAVPTRRVSVKPLVPDAWAHRHNLTFADALYVVVAEHLHAELATADTRLANAPGLSVPTITP